MSEAELIFTALADLSTRQIAESAEAKGLPENASAAKTGGQLAKRARLELEGRTGKKVVSGENFFSASYADASQKDHEEKMSVTETRDRDCATETDALRSSHPSLEKIGSQSGNSSAHCK